MYNSWYLYKLDIVYSNYRFGLVPHQYVNIHCPQNGLFIFSTINGIQPEIGITFIFFSGNRTILYKVIEYPLVELRYSTTANNFSIKAGDTHLDCILYKLDSTTPLNQVWMS